jgi:hypothetical protein
MAYHAKKSIESYLNAALAGEDGIAASAAYLDTVNPSGVKIDALLDDLKARKPATLADTMTLADAYGTLSIAWGLVDLADAKLDTEPATEEEALQAIMEATIYYAAASHIVDGAEDRVDIGLGIGKAKPAETAKLTRLSEALRKAAEANIDYFDDVVVNEYAESEGVSMAVMKSAFMSYDLNYAFALSSINSAHYLKDKIKRKEAAAIAVMGNSLASFALSSGLIAKYYSLGAEMDDSGNITGVAQEKALINMLNLAEDSTVENINAANKAGASPVMSMLYLEGGKVLREGTFDNKFEALTDFWLGGTEARLLTILAGVKAERSGNK